ncbi:MAG: hypothetical protein J6B77_06175 [Clostridia bacterium]|nr:hypothetical protein [Clostridia bacterium]
MSSKASKSGELLFSKNISMFRKFTNVIAGTGTVFALLHVFIGYMGFDKTPNATTGEVPKFLDVPEYQFYLVLALGFLLSLLTAAIFRKLPSLALIPATATTTYVLLLFDAEALTEGKMTFILFSLFVFAGNLAVSLYARGRFSRDLLRYVVCCMGVFFAGWAITIFFRAPGMAEQMYGAVKPIEDLDGIGAVRAFERNQALAALAEEEHEMSYMILAALQFLAASATLILPRVKVLTRVLSLGLFGYIAVAFAFSHLSYYPMLFVVPMLAYVVVCQALAAVPEPEEDEEEPSVQDEPEATEKGSV